MGEGGFVYLVVDILVLIILHHQVQRHYNQYPTTFTTHQRNILTITNYNTKSRSNNNQITATMYTTTPLTLALLFSFTSNVFATPTPIPQSTPLFVSKIPSTSLTTRQTATSDLIVQCKANVFQNPDDDITAVVCQADAHCEGGDDEALEVVDSEGRRFFEVGCFGCPASAKKAGITDGCVFV